MTVKELKELLSEYDDNMVVVKGMFHGTWQSILRCELMDIYYPVLGKMAMEPITYLKII